jgi:hypothetical protein
LTKRSQSNSLPASSWFRRPDAGAKAGLPAVRLMRGRYRRDA